MTTVNIIFYFFFGLAALAASGIVFSKNVFKSALFLLVCLLALSGIYVLAFAEFLAVTQILIYAGGILVVIIFGIMLTTKISGKPLVVNNGNIPGGWLAGISVFVLLATYLPQEPLSQVNNAKPENISTIGLKIFIDYTLPFEAVGLLLLVSLIGAGVITSHLKTKV
jgi:NADH-quinone oxidoreductase subunit J